MKREQLITWFAGLFEGEGSFTFKRGKPYRMSISMTDLDVLERVRDEFGGSILSLTKRKERWKDAWVWYIGGESSRSLAQEIYPYLLSRRQKRCQEYIDNLRTQKQYNNDRLVRHESLKIECKRLREEGLLQREIASILEIDRSTVSKLLK